MSYIGKGVEVVTFNTATTLDVAGNITVGGTVDGRDVATDGTKLDTIAANAIANLSEDTTPQLGGNLDLNTSNVIGTGNINVTGSITGTSFVSTGDMSFTNNSKAIFGTSPSLEIYHDGSNSILDDVGAGNFKMQLAGADKLEITSTGVDVTGNITVTGTVDGRDIATDGTKLDGIEALADVTDDTNVRAAGAVMTTGVSTLADSAYFKGAPTHGFRFNDNGDTYNNFIIKENGDTYTRGSVGIGVSPLANLDVKGSNSRIRWDLSNAYTYQGATNTAASAFAAAYYDGSEHRWLINSSTKAMIDSSGNLLIGKTTYGNVVGTGGQIGASGVAIFTSSSDAPLYLNRTTSEGTIVDLRYNGTVVGSIGNAGSYLQIDTNLYSGLFLGSGAVFPKNNGSLSDNVNSLGSSSYRWKDLYLSGNAYIGNAVTSATDGSTSLVLEGIQHIFRKGSAGSYAEYGRFDTSGSLLVGTSSKVISGTTYGLEVKNSLPAVFMADASFTSLTYGGVNFYRPANAAGNGNGISFGLNNSSSAQAEYGYIGAVIEDNTAGVQDGSLLFATSVNGTRTERLRILSTGGITFNGDTAAANALNDYEFGFYTPSFLGSTTSGSQTYSYRTGVYTKIGNIVKVWVDMTLTANSGQSGTPVITLPFTSASAGQLGVDSTGSQRHEMGSWNSWATNNTFTGSDTSTGWITTSSAHMSMYRTGGTSDPISAWSINTTGRISGTIWYTTA
jgi:hypothetical protein